MVDLGLQHVVGEVAVQVLVHQDVEGPAKPEWSAMARKGQVLRFVMLARRRSLQA